MVGGFCWSPHFPVNKHEDPSCQTMRSCCSNITRVNPLLTGSNVFLFFKACCNHTGNKPAQMYPWHPCIFGISDLCIIFYFMNWNGVSNHHALPRKPSKLSYSIMGNTWCKWHSCLSFCMNSLPWRANYEDWKYSTMLRFHGAFCAAPISCWITAECMQTKTCYTLYYFVCCVMKRNVHQIKSKPQTERNVFKCI